MSMSRQLLIGISLSTVVLGSTIMYRYNNTGMHIDKPGSDVAIRHSSERDHGMTMLAGEGDANAITRDTSSSIEQKTQHANLASGREPDIVYEDDRSHNLQSTVTVEGGSDVTLMHEPDSTAKLTDPVRMELSPGSHSAETAEAGSSKVVISELLLERTTHNPSTSSATQNVPLTPPQTAPVQQYEQGSVSPEQAQMMLEDPAMQTRLAEMTRQASEQVQAIADSLQKAESELQQQQQ